MAPAWIDAVGPGAQSDEQLLLFRASGASVEPIKKRRIDVTSSLTGVPSSYAGVFSTCTQRVRILSMSVADELGYAAFIENKNGIGDDNICVLQSTVFSEHVCFKTVFCISYYLYLSIYFIFILLSFSVQGAGETRYICLQNDNIKHCDNKFDIYDAQSDAKCRPYNDFFSCWAIQCIIWA